MKLIRSQLLSKLERLLNEIRKTLRFRNVVKFSTHFIGNLIELNRIGEILMHGSFLKNFIKLEKKFGNLRKHVKSSSIINQETIWDFLTSFLLQSIYFLKRSVSLERHRNIFAKS